MQFWTAFWAALLVVALTIFAGLAVVVSIGGFFDVKALLRSIGRRHIMEEGRAADDQNADGRYAGAGPDTPR